MVRVCVSECCSYTTVWTLRPGCSAVRFYRYTFLLCPMDDSVMTACESKRKERQGVGDVTTFKDRVKLMCLLCN